MSVAMSFVKKVFYTVFILAAVPASLYASYELTTYVQKTPISDFNNRMCENVHSLGWTLRTSLFDPELRLEAIHPQNTRFLYDAEKNAVLCVTPKGGATAYKSLILHHLGKYNMSRVSSEKALDVHFQDNTESIFLPQLKKGPFKGKTFFVMRNPIERLVSMYHDKIIRTDYMRIRNFHWVREINKNDLLAFDRFLLNLDAVLSTDDPHIESQSRHCRAPFKYDFMVDPENKKQVKDIIGPIWDVNLFDSFSTSHAHENKINTLNKMDRILFELERFESHPNFVTDFVLYCSIVRYGH